MKKFLIICLISGLFCGCEGPGYSTETIVVDDIIGQYRPNFSDGIEDILTLRADSTFTQYYLSNDSSVVTNSGRYRFMGSTQYTIAFYGYNEFHSPKYQNDLSQRGNDVSQSLPLSCYKNEKGIFLTYSFGHKLYYQKLAGN